ncbi:DUF6188 family protein [Paenarthrobacter histidinolovorans]|uniref:DUF6188 family protein n=1 Tax=Paenarthrobacter histidinolovorans TaxID=43664 RepID=UPI0016632518|nr:DUF6188 family protein [Paenarthrobacter histidinolovorans]GGJ18108.1 hypothetical protein GCM10010052_14250 [Paenarthrobacter histidinolovorans]
MSDIPVDDHVLWSWPVAPGPDLIVQCRVDYAFTICTDGGMVLRIGSVFTLKTAAGSIHQLDPNGEPTRLGPALSITQSSIVAGFADDRGALHVEFSDGSVIDVPADNSYEAWTINGPQGLLLVSCPGGSIASWGLRTG